MASVFDSWVQSQLNTKSNIADVVSEHWSHDDVHSLLRPVFNHIGDTGTLCCDDKEWKDDQWSSEERGVLKFHRTFTINRINQSEFGSFDFRISDVRNECYSNRSSSRNPVDFSRLRLCDWQANISIENISLLAVICSLKSKSEQPHFTRMHNRHHLRPFVLIQPSHS